MPDPSPPPRLTVRERIWPGECLASRQQLLNGEDRWNAYLANGKRSEHTDTPDQLVTTTETLRPTEVAASWIAEKFLTDLGRESANIR